MSTPYLITGSNAFVYYLPNSGIEPKDLDVFYPDTHSAPCIENNMRTEFYALPNAVYEALAQNQNRYLTLESLYMLKLSHAEYDIHWRKTIDHIQKLKHHLSLHHNVLREELFDHLLTSHAHMFNTLKDYWKIRHKDKKKINLNKSRDSFFKDAVKRKYDHDTLHELVAYYNQPLYKSILKRNHEVMLDKHLWLKLSFDDKIKLCREEIFVIALERILIPRNFETSEYTAYQLALKHLVTKMTTGWWPTFVCDHYDILYKFDINYMKLFQSRAQLKENIQCL